MSWDEAVYTINEVGRKIDSTDKSGIPPRNMRGFSVFIEERDPETNLVSKVKIIYSCPFDTVIDNQLICKIKGVKFLKKKGSRPINENDGEVLKIIDDITGDIKGEFFNTGFSEDTDYYYAAFPYSDHGVYNISEYNTRKIKTGKGNVWGFIHDWNNLDPDTNISYGDETTGWLNTGYDRLIANLDLYGYTSYGGWKDFLLNIIGQKPAMVHWDGTLDYWLDPNDYSKKLDGSPSDYMNTNYDGGCFVWLNKIYTKVTYDEDNKKMIVEFSDSKMDEDFIPVGFINKENLELEGVWIPMVYTSFINTNKLAFVFGNLTPYSLTRINSNNFVNYIKNLSENTAFLGTPIINIISIILLLLSKSTDIIKYQGYGLSGYTRDDFNFNKFVTKNDIYDVVEGFYGRGNKYNSYKTNNGTPQGKSFHSSIFGTYFQSFFDPYIIRLNNIYYGCPNYIYEFIYSNVIPEEHKKYILTSLQFSNSNKTSVVPNRLQKTMCKISGNNTEEPVKEFGEIPSFNYAQVSAELGLTDDLYVHDASSAETIFRFGNASSGIYNGPFRYALLNGSVVNGDVYNQYTAAPIILPDPGYKPF